MSTTMKILSRLFFQNNLFTGKILFVYLCLSPILLLGADLIFHSEHLEFEIFPERCEVTGYYTFRNDNRDPLQQTLIYPFPVQETLPFPASLSVTDSSGIPIAYERGANEIIFPVIVPGESCSTYKVCYTQPTPEHFMAYILNTTMRWHFPLTSAEFIIIAPGDIQIESISMSDYKVSRENDKTKYRIFRENFSTDKNLIIQWSLK